MNTAAPATYIQGAFTISGYIIRRTRVRVRVRHAHARAHARAPRGAVENLGTEKVVPPESALGLQGNRDSVPLGGKRPFLLSTIPRGAVENLGTENARAHVFTSS